MAGIDKTYAKSIQEIEEFLDWAEKTNFTCPNGEILKVSDYCYLSKEYLKEEGVKEEMERWFNEKGEIPIMNTPTYLDYFLIKHCPIKFVQERMEEVYPKDYTDSIKNGTSEWDTFKRPTPGRKLKWIFGKPKRRRDLRGWLSVHDVKFKDSDDYPHYNDETRKWIFPGELGTWNTSCADLNCRSIKAITRQILKWGFPEGTTITIYGAHTTNKGIILKICK